MIYNIELDSIDKLTELLKENPGIIVLKLHADWCAPCKRIAPIVDEYFNKENHKTLCIYIDIDDTLEIFSFFKKKRIVNGVPALLAYFKGNEHYYPDDSCLGGDLNEVEQFFKRCDQEL